MTTSLYSQALPDTLKNVSENTSEFKDTATLTLPISVEEYKLAADVLQLAELKNNENTAMFLSQTVSQQYKKVSQDLDPENKRKIRKKTLKELMQQSFFHGANWMGSNFIA